MALPTAMVAAMAAVASGLRLRVLGPEILVIAAAPIAAPPARGLRGLLLDVALKTAPAGIPARAAMVPAAAAGIGLNTLLLEIALKIASGPAKAAAIAAPAAAVGLGLKVLLRLIGLARSAEATPEVAATPEIAAAREIAAAKIV